MLPHRRMRCFSASQRIHARAHRKSSCVMPTVASLSHSSGATRLSRSKASSDSTWRAPHRRTSSYVANMSAAAARPANVDTLHRRLLPELDAARAMAAEDAAAHVACRPTATCIYRRTHHGSGMRAATSWRRLSSLLCQCRCFGARCSFLHSRCTVSPDTLSPIIPSDCPCC